MIRLKNVHPAPLFSARAHAAYCWLSVLSGTLNVSYVNGATPFHAESSTRFVMKKATTMYDALSSVTFTRRNRRLKILLILHNFANNVDITIVNPTMMSHGTDIHAISLPLSDWSSSLILMGRIESATTAAPVQIKRRKRGCNFWIIESRRFRLTHIANPNATNSTTPIIARPANRIFPGLSNSGGGSTFIKTSNDASRPSQPGYEPPSTTPNETALCAVPGPRIAALAKNSRSIVSPTSNVVRLWTISSGLVIVTQLGFNFKNNVMGKSSLFTTFAFP
mmetsp:Transcript_11459/g.27379  ORF Transcript_11459/g.27379 Transcript_11459/m.27379 type:complete len:279 (-) Transcript_11459:2544-3380(-)